MFKPATFKSSGLVDETAVQLCSRSKVNPLLKVTSVSILSVKPLRQHTDLEIRSLCDVTKGFSKLVTTPSSRVFFLSPSKNVKGLTKPLGSAYGCKHRAKSLQKRLNSVCCITSREGHFVTSWRVVNLFDFVRTDF